MVMICITPPTPLLIAMIIIRPPHDCPDDLQSIIVQEPSVCLDETSGATLIARAHVPNHHHHHSHRHHHHQIMKGRHPWFWRLCGQQQLLGAGEKIKTIF